MRPSAPIVLLSIENDTTLSFAYHPEPSVFPIELVTFT